MVAMAVVSETVSNPTSSEDDREKTAGSVNVVASPPDDDNDDVNSVTSSLRPVTLPWKMAAIFLVTCIGFGSNWSSGITGAMKTTLKKELGINNTQYALLDGSQDFMVTVLMLLSGLVTDRIGGAGKTSADL
jgi:hypothetical protein